MIPTPWLGATVLAAATGAALAVAARWASVPARRTDGPVPSRAESFAVRWRRVGGAPVVERGVAWWRARRDRAARTAQLPEFVDGVVRSARAGTSLPVALRDGAEVVGPPVLDDVTRVERDVALGVSLAVALRRWSTDVASDDLDLFVTACVLGAEMGRGTADALEGVARTLSDRRDVAAEGHAAAAQARASAVLLAALPVAFLGVLAVADPRSLTVLVATPAGWACVATAVGLDAAGLWWMRRLIGAVA